MPGPARPRRLRESGADYRAQPNGRKSVADQSVAGLPGRPACPVTCRPSWVASLEQVLSSKDHQQKAEQLRLEPRIMKGDEYRKFLKDNEQATKKLMGW
jgi:tripartite-type tricarboxylate transporter receptor subunit TctC